MAARIPLKLTRKRNALAYEREQLQARVRTVEEELRALDFAITVVEPSWKPPKRARRPPRPYRLAKGKITAETLRTLKEREDFASSVAMALRRFERRGVLEITQKNSRTGALHWRLRPTPWKIRAA